MDNQTLDERISTRGKQFLTSIGDEAPTVFNKKLLDRQGDGLVHDQRTVQNPDVSVR
jgi:hypothetical protein